ncbi:MAG: hypothetical protein ACK2T6_00890 [Anaerolineae bacterium]
MPRSAVAAAIALALTTALTLSAPPSEARGTQDDDTPITPRLVVFELFNRSESGG